MEIDSDKWRDLALPDKRLLSSSTIIDIKNATDCDSIAPQAPMTTEYEKNLTYRFKSTNAFGNAEYTNTFTNSSTINNNNNNVSSKGKSKIFPGRLKKRVVLKNGSVNLSKERVEKRSQRYLQDTFTTMVDIQWRWNLLVFSMGFLLSWLGFAVVWYLIAYAHGDLDGPSSNDRRKCVNGVDTFATAFLFSVETQHTIGYGSRYTNEECPEAIFVMCVQSITGVMIQCFVVGFVFAKLSRPKKRSQTLMFSRNACICLRDGKLCLMFRVGDVRNRSHIIGASISALVIDRKITSEGEVIPYYHNRVDVKFDNSDSNVFLVWPATIVHEVDSSSPFYSMSADACEILWGHRFEHMISYRKDTGQYRVDYSKFNNTYEVDTPTSSAKDYYESLKIINDNIKLDSFVPLHIFNNKFKEDSVKVEQQLNNDSNSSLFPFKIPIRIPYLKTFDKSAN